MRKIWKLFKELKFLEPIVFAVEWWRVKRKSYVSRTNNILWILFFDFFLHLRSNCFFFFFNVKTKNKKLKCRNFKLFSVFELISYKMVYLKEWNRLYKNELSEKLYFLDPLIFKKHFYRPFFRVAKKNMVF